MGVRKRIEQVSENSNSISANFGTFGLGKCQCVRKNSIYGHKKILEFVMFLKIERSYNTSLALNVKVKSGSNW